MKRIIILVTTLAATLAFTACGNRSTGKNNQTSEMAAMAVTQVDDLLARAETLTGQKVTIEGVCTHICRHGGRKLFLMGSDNKKVIRVEAGDKIGSFGPECVNNLVRVTGTLTEDRIDEAYLTQWEQRVKDQTAEKHDSDEAGCSTEKQARGESAASGPEKRIAAFRARIADRKAKEDKDYLSFYHVDGQSYEIIK